MASGLQRHNGVDQLLGSPVGLVPPRSWSPSTPSAPTSPVNGVDPVGPPPPRTCVTAALAVTGTVPGARRGVIAGGAGSGPRPSSWPPGTGTRVVFRGRRGRSRRVWGPRRWTTDEGVGARLRAAPGGMTNQIETWTQRPGRRLAAPRGRIGCSPDRSPPPCCPSGSCTCAMRACWLRDQRANATVGESGPGGGHRQHDAVRAQLGARHPGRPAAGRGPAHGDLEAETCGAPAGPVPASAAGRPGVDFPGPCRLR